MSRIVLSSLLTVALAARLHRVLAVSLLLALSGGVARADLYRWFKLDEGEGDVATDSSPNGEHGEIFDATWVEDPDRGTVLEFDGEFSWVEAGYIPLMDLENDFSWAFWENQADFQASPSNDIIIGNRGGDGGPDTSPREFIKFTANRFEYHMNGGHANDMAYGANDPEYIPSDGEWRHHVVVKDGEQLAYFRDGEFFNEHELLDPMFSEDPLPFGLGGQGGLGAGEFWAGLLSDVRLYDHALTEAEIAEIIGGGGGLEGDYNGDGVLDGTDINLQAVEMKKDLADQDLAKFDHNDDGVIDVGTPAAPGDRLIWVKDLRMTSVGDSNFDDVFDSGDLVQVFGEGKYDTGEMATWEQGDWSGDMLFDSGDLVLAFQDGGYVTGAAAAVPEPSSLVLAMLAISLMWVRWRK